MFRVCARNITIVIPVYTSYWVSLQSLQYGGFDFKSSSSLMNDIGLPDEYGAKEKHFTQLYGCTAVQLGWSATGG